ncbi:hypothetical protein [Saccharopolyspora phatthalungensis]|uniref:Uncharacterized protein n=1 Tax=Saccharopolyspora phatthalungensis TaxID=664693 RepID=A0A840QEL0_9PSEU|nr:hypothetical protein [Saccharopolyspora phatthalungensis]MBB5158290.1 hypothetical protein [Saccharopolyspora phatthalungensis]
MAEIATSASASSERGTTASISAHTCARLTDSTTSPASAACSAKSSCAPVTSHNTPNAATSFADAFPSLGRVRSFSLADSRSARASSFEEISTSSRSRASSTARV